MDPRPCSPVGDLLVASSRRSLRVCTRGILRKSPDPRHLRASRASTPHPRRNCQHAAIILKGMLPCPTLTSYAAGMSSLKLILHWYAAALIVALLSIPLTGFYGTVWLVPCGPMLLFAIAVWPFIAVPFPWIDRLVPMSIALSGVSLFCAGIGAIIVFGTISSPLELLIPFAECFTVVLIPRLIWPTLIPGAFSRPAA